ncbi:MAG: 16S rRNA (uracil(1498)-N(3))-methyltransferase [Peptococcaceae bacterium]|nr:16S rRNA (uracil(1498)-N(3))-methyltransferase [Peptococcaceae bacterium]
MSIPRFFLFSGKIGRTVYLDGSDAHHITRVLRMRPGAKISVVDSRGKAYLAKITGIDPGRVSARLIREDPAGGEPDLSVVLVQGLAKGDKMDLVVQKATEVGVKGIVPLVTERAVVKLSETKARQRRDRWQKIAVEAARQSKRRVVPQVAPVQRLDEFLGSLPCETAVFFLWEEEHSRIFKEELRSREKPGEVYLLVGPEGGFTPGEAAAAQAAGAVPVSLGPRILRTETAGVVAAALVLYEWGDLGG